MEIEISDEIFLDELANVKLCKRNKTDWCIKKHTVQKLKCKLRIS